ncbi:MAG: hypothetical protein ACM3ZO_02095 [Clostridia bacterium]
MELWAMKNRLVDACLALGHICTGEAKWADDPEVKAAMVRHAIGFLDAARGFLQPCTGDYRARRSEHPQQESHPH